MIVFAAHGKEQHRSESWRLFTATEPLGACLHCCVSRLVAWTAFSKEGPLVAKLSWPRCLPGLLALLVAPIGSDFRQKHCFGTR